MSSDHSSNAPPTYDHAILSSVPDPTGAAIPEAYDVSLPDESRYRRAATPPNGAPSDPNRPTTLGYSPSAASNPPKEDSANPHEHEPVVEKVPWYRTRWGIGVIALITFIVGGIVGGVVAGTHHSNNKSPPSGQGQQQVPSQASPSSTTTQQGQPEAPPLSTSVSTTTEVSSTPTFVPTPTEDVSSPPTSVSTTTEVSSTPTSVPTPSVSTTTEVSSTPTFVSTSTENVSSLPTSVSTTTEVSSRPTVVPTPTEDVSSPPTFVPTPTEDVSSS